MSCVKNRGGVNEELLDTGPVVDWSLSGFLCILKGSFNCCYRVILQIQGVSWRTCWNLGLDILVERESSNA